MQVTLKRGLFLLSFISILGLSSGISLANTFEIDAEETSKSKNCSDGDNTDPHQKSDSTKVLQEKQNSDNYNAESEFKELNDDAQLNKPDNSPVTVSESETYYGGEDNNEDTSQSLISFNFLYYLLQKFKISDTLGY